MAELKLTPEQIATLRHMRELEAGRFGWSTQFEVNGTLSDTRRLRRTQTTIGDHAGIHLATAKSFVRLGLCTPVKQYEAYEDWLTQTGPRRKHWETSLTELGRTIRLNEQVEKVRIEVYQGSNRTGSTVVSVDDARKSIAHCEADPTRFQVMRSGVSVQIYDQGDETMFYYWFPNNEET
ncbi:hypothetical protein [Nocardia brasiliensis]|uniref:hypothetical protein n=1 Tax=Nocardia brasiliensis TaxID=37326 RepID=UPI002454FD35|nr:hypothetical protein [Nocardia brasiliensis]